MWRRISLGLLMLGLVLQLCFVVALWQYHTFHAREQRLKDFWSKMESIGDEVNGLSGMEGLRAFYSAEFFRVAQQEHAQRRDVDSRKDHFENLDNDQNEFHENRKENEEGRCGLLSLVLSVHRARAHAQKENYVLRMNKALLEQEQEFEEYIGEVPVPEKYYPTFPRGRLHEERIVPPKLDRASWARFKFRPKSYSTGTPPGKIYPQNCILIMNNSLVEHPQLDEVIRNISGINEGTKPRNRKNIPFRVQNNFPWPDPWEERHYHRNVAENLASHNEPRKQIVQFVHAFLSAYSWGSRWILILEDDMEPCDSMVLARIHDVIDRVTRFTKDEWSVIRVGFGGSGIVLHTRDLPMLSDYLLSNMDRKPIDWLIPEWANKTTFQRKMSAHMLSESLFTYRYSPFLHIGVASSFDSRDWTRDNFNLPKCYGENLSLRPEEKFKHKECGYTDISPCPELSS